MALSQVQGKSAEKMHFQVDIAEKLDTWLHQNIAVNFSGTTAHERWDEFVTNYWAVQSSISNAIE